MVSVAPIIYLRSVAILVTDPIYEPHYIPLKKVGKEELFPRISGGRIWHLPMIFKRKPRLVASVLVALAVLVACGGGSEKAAEHYVAGTDFAAAGHW
jgi:hypothetical protein